MRRLGLGALPELLGALPEGADQMAAADGREKTEAASRARLARMVGRDAGDASPEAWRALAAWLAESQLRQVVDAALLVLSRAGLPEDAPVLGAGAGCHVARVLAARGVPLTSRRSLMAASLHAKHARTRGRSARHTVDARRETQRGPMTRRQATTKPAMRRSKAITLETLSVVVWPARVVKTMTTVVILDSCARDDFMYGSCQ